MAPSITAFLALALAAGLTRAQLEPRKVVFNARELSLPETHRITSRDAYEEPCKILSDAFSAANGSTTTPGGSVVLPMPPSLGIACLRTVPVAKKRDLELLDYLMPLISFQSTIEILANPPEEYLVPGVDIFGGIEIVRQKLEADQYESQYDVMKDFFSIFVAASDNHFYYNPALLSTMMFVRRHFSLVSVSKDGIEKPEIYLRANLTPMSINEVELNPSPVETVDGMAVAEFLERTSSYNSANYQDPDARFNALFLSIPGYATGQEGTLVATNFEIPDNYTVTFKNGSTLLIENQILFPAGQDFSDITSGEDVQQRFEIPPSSTATSSSSSEQPSPSESDEPSTTTSSAPPPPPTMPGYPYPLSKQDAGSVAAYFLNETGYEDTAVLSILSFMPLSGAAAAEDDLTDGAEIEFFKDARRVITTMIEEAHKQNRDKLIIDLSANGGGIIKLANEIYRLIFPEGNFTIFDRYRATESLGAASKADFDAVNAAILSNSEDDWPVGPNDEEIKSGKEFFGPYFVKGQNVTTAFQDNVRRPLDRDGESYYYNGFHPDEEPDVKEAPFLPENILIVTDGACASSCDILTGLISRFHGVKTLAIGGRPLELPMQAMGGVKGTQADEFANFVQAFENISESISEEKDKKKREMGMRVLEEAEDAIPSQENPPLLPLIEGTQGGGLNSHNGYTVDDLEGYPLQFRYESAWCRLFYTAEMLASPVEVWRRAAEVAWKGGKCVKGSTTAGDGGIGEDAPGFDPRVKSRVPGIVGPGALAWEVEVEVGDGDGDGDGPRLGKEEEGTNSDKGTPGTNTASRFNEFTLAGYALLMICGVMLLH